MPSKAARTNAGRSAHDFARLERAVVALIDRGREIQTDNARLRSELTERDARIRDLDEKVLEINQRRQDTIKRIDDLIAQMDQLDGQLERAQLQRNDRLKEDAL